MSGIFQHVKKSDKTMVYKKLAELVNSVNDMSEFLDTNPISDIVRDHTIQVDSEIKIVTIFWRDTSFDKITIVR